MSTGTPTYRLASRIAIGIALIGLAMLWPTVGRLNPQERTTRPPQQDYRIYLRGYTFDPLRSELQIEDRLKITRPPQGPAYHARRS